MTQVDSSAGRHLGTPLDSDPTSGQGQAATVDATTPLPDGWGSFCSKASPNDPNEIGRWYASAPWHVDTLKLRKSADLVDRELLNKLSQTVDAATWPELYNAVASQVYIYNTLMGGEEE